MAYSVISKKSGAVYFLHAQTTQTEKGSRTIYFFSKEEKDGAIDQLPDGYVVTENERTGLPLLKRAS